MDGWLFLCTPVRFSHRKYGLKMFKCSGVSAVRTSLKRVHLLWFGLLILRVWLSLASCLAPI